MSEMGFHADYDGIGELLRGSIGLAAVMPHAEAVKVTAETIAPVYTGEYKSAFGIETTETRDRVEVQVVNYSPHALDVEFGRGNTPRHRTLGRALSVGIH